MAVEDSTPTTVSQRPGSKADDGRGRWRGSRYQRPHCLSCIVSASTSDRKATTQKPAAEKKREKKKKKLLKKNQKYPVRSQISGLLTAILSFAERGEL